MNPVYDRENRIYRVPHHGPSLDVFVRDMRWYRDANSTDKQRRPPRSSSSSERSRPPPDTRVVTVNLRDNSGGILWSKDLEPLR